MMSKYIEPWSRCRFCLSQISGFLVRTNTATTMPRRKQAAVRTNRNDSKDLLLLVAYAKKLQETQRNIDEVCTLMQHTIPLEGLISAQDNRTLQSAKSCIQSLHVRVEALANVLEQTLISQQLQFMHMRAQHGPTSHSTFQLESNPCVAHNQDEPDNTPNGPANKEVGAKTRNHQPNDGKP